MSSTFARRELSILKFFPIIPAKNSALRQIIRDAQISAHLNNKFESFIQAPLKLLKPVKMTRFFFITLF